MSKLITTIRVKFLEDETNQIIIINESDFDEKIHKVVRRELKTTKDETKGKTKDPKK